MYSAAALTALGPKLRAARLAAEKPHLILHPLKITLERIDLTRGGVCRQRIICLFLFKYAICRILDLRIYEFKRGLCRIGATRPCIFATHVYRQVLKKFEHLTE